MGHERNTRRPSFPGGQKDRRWEGFEDSGRALRNTSGDFHSGLSITSQHCCAMSGTEGR